MKRAISIIFVIIIATFSCVISASAANLPSAYSALNNGYVTPVKNQYNGCNCWAFAAMSCLESDAIKKNYETLNSADFSEAYFTWATMTASGISTDINSAEKQNAEENMYLDSNDMMLIYPALAEGCGIQYEKDYPFNSNINSMGNYDTSRYYNNIGYTIDTAVKIEDITSAKEWILEHGSVGASVKMNSKKVSSYTVNYSTSTESDHAICIVGWNDDFDKNLFKYNDTTAPMKNGAWLVKNSYGTNWGNNGYFWVSYEDASLNYFGFSICKINSDTMYTYNGTAFSASYSNENSITEANIFDIKDKTNATDVSFYTMSNKTTANISIIKLNDKYTSPTDGTTVYNSDVYCKFKGYHKFNTEVALDSGSYAVVIKLSKDGTVAIPIEQINDSQFTCTAQKGQSFMSYNGSQWYDVVTKNNGNLIINLYTRTGESLLDKESSDTQINTELKACNNKINEFKGQIAQFFEAIIRVFLSIEAVLRNI